MKRLAILLGLLLASTTTPAPAADAPFIVVAHPGSAVSTIDRAELDRIYRRVRRYWPDGTRILPVNAPFDSDLRKDFSRLVLRSGIDQLIAFWNRQYFQGILPPPILRSDAAVLAYVGQTPGAIGYVRSSALDPAAHVLQVRFDD